MEKIPGPAATPRGRFNRRRIILLMVVIIIVVFSFIAGRLSGRKTYIQPENPAAIGQPGSDRVEIPPDSLPH